jgi:hypothetical protein
MREMRVVFEINGAGPMLATYQRMFMWPLESAQESGTAIRRLGG